MAQALVAALALLSASAQAQTPSSDTPSSSTPSSLAPSAAPSREETEQIRREVDAKVEEAKKQMREELRAQLATQSAAQGWQEEWVEEKRKLDLVVPGGYFRVRPELFNKFDLGRPPDPDGYSIFPHQGGERTVTGVNMRFRFEPTLNISEEVRIKTQMDALDNLVWGSTPDYAFSRSDRTNVGLLTNGQVAPQTNLNSSIDSIRFKRVWGEVSTPVGILRFGRMGSQWGLGILHNDGNCLDCDYGETVDRAQFVIEPLSGYFIIPMFDMNATGLTASSYQNEGPPYNLSQLDDTYSYVLVLARRDTEAQAKAKLDSNLGVFNYGVHATYRTEKYESATQGQAFAQVNAYDPQAATANRLYRNGSVYMPDLWVKYERKRFRIELEAAGVFGTTNVAGAADLQNPNPASVPLTITQWGTAAETELRFFDGALKVGLDVGGASGSRTPGFGNHPGRQPLAVNSRPAGSPAVGTVKGDIDGPKYCLAGGGSCPYISTVIRNYQFARDYRIDMILWREILGGVTDAYYVRPNVKYTITDGFSVAGALIYSGAMEPTSTPSGARGLGIEFNLGLRYETDDGFFSDLRYGVLFPLAGLQAPTTFGFTNPSLDVAQAIRASFGIRF